MNNLSPPSNNMSSKILNMQHESFTYSSCQSFQREGWTSVPISGNTTGGLETSAEPSAATATQNSIWIWNWSVRCWESQRNEDSGAASDSPEKGLAPPDHTTRTIKHRQDTGGDAVTFPDAKSASDLCPNFCLPHRHHQLSGGTKEGINMCLFLKAIIPDGAYN